MVESTTTMLPDTAKIQYTIVNRDEKPREVGLRVVIDTMLGANDGNPFRLGETAIVTDTVFPREELPEFWQAFDTLTNPRVIAQGTLKGRKPLPPIISILPTGERLPITTGTCRWSRGEISPGPASLNWTALRFYKWEPVTVAPADTCTYVLSYGLGGVTVKPGELQLGVTSRRRSPGGDGEELFDHRVY